MQNFKHPELGEIRVLGIDGAPWFVGKDVATALGYVDTDQALRKRVDDEDKQTRQIDGTDQNRNMIVINEDGLLNLIFSCRRPCAKVFSKWVMNDIMPTLHSKKENDIAHKNDIILSENAVLSAETGEKISFFSNPEFGEIRGIEINGEPWLVGKDVAAVLGYVNPREALARHVNEVDKQVLLKSQNETLDIPNRGVTIINESGLFSLIFSSKLPGAEKFTHWVTSEVLPSIRKTGMYVSGPQYDINDLSPNLQMAKMLSEHINALFESMARTEMEQKRQAAEQERLAQKQEQQDKALQTVDGKVDGIRDIVVFHPDKWRQQCGHLIAAIARKRGGNSEAYSTTNIEIFDLVDRRGKVSLQTRLTNRRKRMAEEGMSKNKQNKLNKVDIIAEDAKLTEIYIAVIKEKCIQYGVSVDIVDIAK